MKLLVFAASLRKESLNKKLAHSAAVLLKKMPGVEVFEPDFREFEMPSYDGDFEDAQGIPQGAQRLIKAISDANGLVISTPEYNGGIPGTLKNAIDWVSRNDPHPLFGKPVLLLGATPGALGAVRGLWHTRVPLEALNAHVFPQMFGLPKADQAFDLSGSFNDEKTAQRLAKVLRDYVDFVGRVS